MVPNVELNKYDFAWIVRRCPQPVLELVKKHPATVFVAGGFIRAVIAGEEVNDIDLFAPNKKLAKAFAEELARSEEKIHESDNAYTVKVGKMPIQFIHRWTFDSADALIASFDFTIAGAAFWFDGGWQSMCHADYYADLAAKRLIYTQPQRNEDAGGSMLRVLKFYQRGYRIPLNSLGAVIARLNSGVDQSKIDRGSETEEQYAKVITGLLREVDPNVDPSHIAHLPSVCD
jgi:hypothetical protein